MVDMRRMRENQGIQLDEIDARIAVSGQNARPHVDACSAAGFHHMIGATGS
jgi:protein tyrosine phosphatase (PTP) superfamily phosphohydrolase (DUF442 family)